MFFCFYFFIWWSWLELDDFLRRYIGFVFAVDCDFDQRIDQTQKYRKPKKILEINQQKYLYHTVWFCWSFHYHLYIGLSPSKFLKALINIYWYDLLILLIRSIMFRVKCKDQLLLINMSFHPFRKSLVFLGLCCFY